MNFFSMQKSKAQLSKGVTLESEVEETVSTRAGKATAMLVAIEQQKQKPIRRLGGLKGKILVADDFDAPLPDDILDLFEGK